MYKVNEKKKNIDADRENPLVSIIIPTYNVEKYINSV